MSMAPNAGSELGVRVLQGMRLPPEGLLKRREPRAALGLGNLGEVLHRPAVVRLGHQHGQLVRLREVVLVLQRWEPGVPVGLGDVVRPASAPPWPLDPRPPPPSPPPPSSTSTNCMHGYLIAEHLSLN